MKTRQIKVQTCTLSALYVQFGCLKRTPQVEKLIMCNESNSPVLRNRQIPNLDLLGYANFTGIVHNY